MTPVVSVIIPHHLPENQKYLDLALQSIQNQYSSNFMEVLVTSSSPTKPQVPDWVKLIWPMPPGHFSHKINQSVKFTNPESKYILLGQDDLIFGKNAIKGLVDVCGDYAAIVNPVSNCDLQQFFAGEIKIGSLTLERFYTLEKLHSSDIGLIMNHQINVPLMFEQKFICFYCTLIPRRVWNMVGELDENFQTGYEDNDYCSRAIKMGIKPAITTNSFVFHFGGRTSSHTVTEENKKHNPAYYQSKHGNLP